MEGRPINEPWIDLFPHACRKTHSIEQSLTMKIICDPQMLYSLPEEQWERMLMDKHGLTTNLDKYLIPSSRLSDRSIRHYLNSVIVYNLLKKKDFDANAPFEAGEALREKGVLSKYDAYTLFQLLGMENLIQTEVKHATKLLMISSLLGSTETIRDEARDLLIEKNIRAGARSADNLTYSDIFGETDITSCKKLRESGMKVDQIMQCIQDALDGTIDNNEKDDWNLLFEFMGSSELSPEQLETGMYRVIQDRLRKPVAKRMQLHSMEDVLSKKKKRADSDTESSTIPKRRKFADISEDSVHDVPQLEGKAAAVMQRIEEVTGIHACTNGKMAYIAKTLAKKEAQAATKHQLYSSMSKDMLLYIAHALIPEERLSCSLFCDMQNVDRPIALHIF
jgi:hypothetical protein